LTYRRFLHMIILTGPVKEKGLDYMAVKQIFVLIILTTLIMSCATTKLWEITDPHKYVEISRADIAEKELIDKKVQYYKDEQKGVYYVEKSGAEKLQGYVLRILATPITIAVDAATVILVIGLLHGHGHYQHIHVK
jgi:hypothetical protein